MPSWFSHFPSTSDGRKGSEIEILIFRQICILALCSKTRDGPWHPLDITFLEFFCIFITFGSKWLRKTPGWWGFQKIWHLGHPNIYLTVCFVMLQKYEICISDLTKSWTSYMSLKVCCTEDSSVWHPLESQCNKVYRSIKSRPLLKAQEWRFQKSIERDFFLLLF